MRLDDEQASSNVEDRRGQRSRRGGFRVPMGRRGGGGIGIGAIVLLGIMWLVFGINPLEMLGGGGFAPQTQQQVPQTQQQQGAPAANDEMGKFASKVLSTTERTWTRVFQENGRKYEEPRMVLFSGFVQSACGAAQSAMGPFYCPLDRKIYIDLSFFRDMSTRLGASGDFAHAYVIAHEVGHHVQTLLGIASKVTRGSSTFVKNRCQPLVGSHGTAGRLSGGSVGTRQQEHSGARRYRRRHQCCNGHR